MAETKIEWTVTYSLDGTETPGRFIRLASKHDAGRLLDGREWNQMPEVA